MTLGTYQFSFNGLTFGAGTPYVVESIDGLTSMSPLRVQDDIRGYQDGQFSGRDFYDARTVTFTILTLGDNTNNAQYYYKQLQAALAPQVLGYYPDLGASTQPAGTLGLFQYQLNTESLSGDSSVTGVKRLWGRVRNITTQVNPEYTFGYISSTVQFHFPDPRYYDDTVKTATGTIAVSLVNNGWATAPTLITINSPSASGGITDNVSGWYMAFSNVNTSYPLVIDTLNRTIKQNGVYVRNLLNTFNYWLTIPASTTTNWSSTIGSMTISYRNAYV